MSGDDELKRLLDEAVARLVPARRTFTEAEALGEVWDAGYEVALTSDPRFAVAREADRRRSRQWRLAEHALANDRLLDALRTEQWDGADLDKMLEQLSAADGVHYIYCPLDDRFTLRPDGTLEPSGQERRVNIPTAVQTTLDTLLTPLLHRWQTAGEPWAVQQVMQTLEDLDWQGRNVRGSWEWVRAWLAACPEVARVGQDYWLPVETLPAPPPEKRLQVLPVFGVEPAPASPLPGAGREANAGGGSPLRREDAAAPSLVPTPRNGEAGTDRSFTTRLRTTHLVQGYLSVPARVRGAYPAREPGEGERSVLRGMWHATGESFWVWLNRDTDSLYGEALADNLAWCEAGDILQVRWTADGLIFQVVGHDDDVAREETRLVDAEALATLRGTLGESYRQSIQAILLNAPQGLTFAELVAALRERQGHTVPRTTVRALLYAAFVQRRGRWFATPQTTEAARRLQAAIQAATPPATQDPMSGQSPPGEAVSPVPVFEVGQIVYLRADPERRGAVIQALPPTGDMPRYRVFHSPTDIRDYYADQLVATEATEADDLTRAVLEGRWLPVDTFRARLTAARLAHPLTDTLYTLRAARIQHIPFQFKPLLRFLRSDQPRLLIADEVGVGKTIEAGLILKELATRQQLGNVLIVCPKALVYKWRAEMRRFDEEFRILTAESLRYCLKEAHLDGAWPAEYARAIVHLELLRTDEHLNGVTDRRPQPGLLTLDPPPQFGLTIIDEAHHVRNPETNSYDVAQWLSEVSEAVLFLSATPVQVGSHNLYYLLNLLRPDLFPEEAVFAEMLEPNRYMTQAARHIRSMRPPVTWRADAAQMLDEALRTGWGQAALWRDPRFSLWHGRLSQPTPLSAMERVQCLRDLEELHTLARVVNRTRRRDIGRFTVREPHTVSIPFTPEQHEFYTRLIAFRQQTLLQTYAPQVVRLITDTLERQASSCLPALVPTLDTFLSTGRFTTQTVSDDPDDAALVDLPPPLLAQARALRQLAARLPSADPKFDSLQRIIDQTQAEAGPGKVLVFSYFLHTLHYLERRLQKSGSRVGLVTGAVPDEEREALRQRFRLPRENAEALDVLLSSEVGCEGLDYEFCDRLVNYDIPWNPMRIEQRIGRIDRFGQVADKVLIFNFITPETVEERIFFRCYDRLGVFRDVVGDLEEILGAVVDNLTQLAFDPTLTSEQAEEKARQTADNALRLMEERRRLEDEGGALLGLDQAVEDLDDVIAANRFVSSDDLRLMVSAFVETPTLGGRLALDERRPGVARLRLNRVGRATLLDRLTRLDRQDRVTTAFARWLAGDEPFMTLTFDPRTALEQRELPFITPVHPLAKLAVEAWTHVSEPLVSAIRVSDPDLPTGVYLFVCDLWETLTVKPELRLMSLAWDLKTGDLCPEVGTALLRLLGGGAAPEAALTLVPSQVRQALQHLDEAAQGLRVEALAQLRDRHAVLLATKLASLEAYHRSRQQRVQADLARATNARVIRMKEAEQGRIKRDYQRQREELLARRDVDILPRRIAAGVLEVIRGE